jgi:hypothetical protein
MKAAYTRILVFVLACLIAGTLFLGSQPRAAVCSHQGRLHPAHRPVLRADLLPSLQHLLGLGVRCFDLDLSPLPDGGSAVAHPAALAAAARPALAGATATAADVFRALGAAGGAPAMLTLELKGALGMDGALLRALGAEAAGAGMQGRVALLGAPAHAPLPAGLLRALAIRDVEGCAEVAALSRDVAIVMPSVACWRDAAVRARVAAWAPAAAAAAAAAGAAPSLRGAVSVWPVDDAGVAGELSALGRAAGLGAALGLVTNAPRELL